MRTNTAPSPVLDSEFIAALLHKLSQPLAAMRGSLEMALLFGRSLEDYRTAVEEAIEQVDRMARMKQTIAELTSGEDLTKGAEAASVFAIILAAVEAVRPDAEQSAVNLVTACPDALIAEVNTRRVTQALISFLAVAVGYSPRGSELQVHCLRNGEHLALGIANPEGVIPEMELPHLFEAFVELTAVNSAVNPGAAGATAGGSGVSLALARRVIEASGGSVRPENLPGVGFRLNIRLPLVGNASCSSAA